MSKIKNQHYVPRFYLRHFLNTNENIFVFDKSSSKIFETKVENIANENYFYDIDELDEVTGVEQFLEKHFQPLETKISTILKNLIDDLNDSNFKRLSKKLKAELAIYLTYQYLRTREQREQMRQMIASITMSMGKAHLDKKGHLAEGLGLNIDDAKFQASMILDRKNVEELASVLNGHLWIVLENKTGNEFYTSDHPLVRRGHIIRSDMSMNGLASQGIEIAFPISPNYIILLIDKDTFGNYLKYENQVLEVTDPRNVEYYNSLQVLHSYRQVYSQSDNFVLAQKMLNKNKEIGNLKRIRIKSNWDNK